MTDHLRAIYELTPAPDEDAAAKAFDITLEQTVELPDGVFSEAIRERIVGRVVTLEDSGPGRFRAVIDFRLAAIGSELTQLLNVLFGNISLKRGIRLADVEWPDSVIAALGGPGHGCAGIRRLVGARQRPLLATALKPLGLGPAALAEICTAFARGGIDLIKDDHGLSDQPSAPFADRLQACQAAVLAVNAAEGRQALYLPTVPAAWPQMMMRARAARDAGCRAVMVSPGLTGFDAIAWLRDELGLAVMAHPTTVGGFFQPDHGIAPEVRLGDLSRLAAADMVIYPNVGGRFGFDQPLCERLNDRLRRPLGGISPALPTPGGGVDVRRAPHWARCYGPDTIFLIGGSLYAQGDLTAAAGRLRHAIEGEP